MVIWARILPHITVEIVRRSWSHQRPSSAPRQARFDAVSMRVRPNHLWFEFRVWRVTESDSQKCLHGQC